MSAKHPAGHLDDSKSPPWGLNSLRPWSHSFRVCLGPWMIIDRSGCILRGVQACLAVLFRLVRPPQGA